MFHTVSTTDGRRNTIEVGQTVLRTGSKLGARDQVEQALIGAIRDRARQRSLVKSVDVATDEKAQQPAQSPLPGLVPAQGREFLLQGPQAVMLLRKALAQQMFLVSAWIYENVK
jgi:hypothetical protein